MLIEELTKKEKKSFIKKIVIFGVLFILLTAFTIIEGFLNLFNPKDFWSYSDELIDGKDNMSGEFVELNVDYLLDYYIQEYTYKNNSVSTKEVKKQYYLFPVDDGLSYYVTLIAPKDYFDEFDNICDETWDYILGEAEQPQTNRVVKGVFVELEDEDLKYAAEYFSQAFDTTYTSEQVLNLVSPMAIKIDYINSDTNVSLLTPIMIVYAALFIFLIYALAKLLRHTYSSGITKAINGDEHKLARMSADYDAAMTFPNNLRVGREFIFGERGSKYVAVPLEEVVWTYGYIHRSKYGTRGYIKIVNDKREVIMLTVLNHKVLNEIVSAIYNAKPYIYVGSTSENHELFKKKNFETMVNNVRSAAAQYNQNMEFGFDNNEQVDYNNDDNNYAQ